jgi:hypothetical protein
VLAGIQTTMIIAIAHEHGAADHQGRRRRPPADVHCDPRRARHQPVARRVGAGWGNAINASTAAALTEAVGWAADAYFGEEQAAA